MVPVESSRGESTADAGAGSEVAVVVTLVLDPDESLAGTDADGTGDGSEVAAVVPLELGPSKFASGAGSGCSCSDGSPGSRVRS